MTNNMSRGTLNPTILIPVCVRVCCTVWQEDIHLTAKICTSHLLEMKNQLVNQVHLKNGH